MAVKQAKNRLSGSVLPAFLLGLLVLLFLTAAAVVIAVGRERNVAHYPGAMAVTSHSNYGGFSSEIRWDNSYFTTDNFTDVYNWYSTTFDMGAESRAIGRCLLLEARDEQLLAERDMNVLLCNTPQGQRIFVSHARRLKLPLP